ncbi:phage major capsid protein [Mycobacterium marinum]|uniref:phage major capsid protein n=1 Tax=Mycobacterium marinum TaxID=1781 RepID=UPI002359CF06|nr:phage major capsid protein [Mycobacterium marinum]MDC8981250.1 phage major capsid protein [Mycobacterium marinum]
MTVEIEEMDMDATRAAAQALLDGVDGDLVGAAAERFEVLRRHAKELQERDRRRNDDLRRITAAAQDGSGEFRLERGAAGDYDSDPLREPRSAEDWRDRRISNPWDMRGMQTFGRDPDQLAGEYRARALSAIERMPGASDNVRSAATRIIEDFDSKDSRLARFALATSTPAYMRAWSKMATNRVHALTPDEQRALAGAEQFRAMSLTDNAGGFLVPFQLDPSVIVQSDGVRNDLREAARVVIATGDVWHGVASTNVSWSFDSEAAEVSDDSTVFSQPSIPNYMARGFIPISIEAAADAANVAQEVGKLLAGGKLDLEGEKFITGTGSGEPTGIVTALTGTSSVVNATSDDTFAVADVYKLEGALPARYRRNASWLANNSIYNLVRGFDQYGGGGFWTNLVSDRPPLLLGRPALEAEAMDGTITTSGSVHNYAMIFGDLSNFVITDRLGMSVEFLPHLFGSNRRPTGQRGWFAFYRTGSDSCNDGGMRMLDVVSAS